MIDVMHQAEDLENLENLHSLCALVQTIRELLIVPTTSVKGTRLNTLRSHDERSQHVRSHFG
jgi:hypothetical protein